MPRRPAQWHGSALIIEQCCAVVTDGQRMPRRRDGRRPSYGQPLRML